MWVEHSHKGMKLMSHVKNPREIERNLKTERVIAMQANPTPGLNETYIVTLGNGMKAVWKPQTVRLACNYRAELLAYKFSKLFDFGLVPPTVERVIEGRIGSLQLFIEGIPRETVVSIDPTKRRMPNNPIGRILKQSYPAHIQSGIADDLKQQDFLDNLIGNKERGPDANWFVSTAMKVVSHDHAQSFTDLTPLQMDDLHNKLDIILEKLEK